MGQEYTGGKRGANTNALTAFLFFILSGVSTAQAGVVQFNTAGTGLADAVTVASAIDGRGTGFVVNQLNPADPSSVIFSESGAYQLTQPDLVSPIGQRDVTMIFSLTGTMSLITGALTLTSGAVDLYSDVLFNYGTASSVPSVAFGANDGAHIASFIVTALNGYNGRVDIQGNAVAGSLKKGYLFSSSGEDLSQSGDLQFDVNIGNVYDDAPSTDVVSEIVCKLSGFPGPGCDGTKYTNSYPYYYVISDGGSVMLSTHLPESGSASLVLLGLLGLGGALSRRKQKKGC